MDVYGAKFIFFQITNDKSRNNFSIFTTVDEETGDRRSKGEPLKSLAKIRQARGRDSKFSHEYAGRPLVGMNLVILKEGKIELGDQIRVRA